jgi:hypothetical protein
MGLSTGNDTWPMSICGQRRGLKVELGPSSSDKKELESRNDWRIAVLVIAVVDESSQKGVVYYTICILATLQNVYRAKEHRCGGLAADK